MAGIEEEEQFEPGGAPVAGGVNGGPFTTAEESVNIDVQLLARVVLVFPSIVWW